MNSIVCEISAFVLLFAVLCSAEEKGWQNQQITSDDYFVFDLPVKFEDPGQREEIIICPENKFDTMSVSWNKLSSLYEEGKFYVPPTESLNQIDEIVKESFDSYDQFCNFDKRGFLKPVEEFDRNWMNIFFIIGSDGGIDNVAFVIKSSQSNRLISAEKWKHLAECLKSRVVFENSTQFLDERDLQECYFYRTFSAFYDVLKR